MRIMILGAGGVFGNITARHLLGHGHEVMAIGRSPVKECYHLNTGKDDPKYQYHQLHIVSEIQGLFQLMDSYQPEIVINFAALAYANSWDNSELYYKTNCLAVVKMVEHLKNQPYLKRFIQIGSSEVYGSTEKPVDENTPTRCTSPYAVSKLAADLHLKTMFRVKGFPMNIIRPCNCYGQGQYTYRIVPKAILYMLQDKTFPLEGGGVAEKSFMYATDLARAIETVIEKGEVGETYNVGVDQPVSMADIVYEICDQLGKEPTTAIQITQGRKGEDSKYWIDSSKIKALGWHPVVSLELGIMYMIQWCQEYKDDLIKEPDTFTLRA